MATAVPRDELWAILRSANAGESIVIAFALTDEVPAELRHEAAARLDAVVASAPALYASCRLGLLEFVAATRTGIDTASTWAKAIAGSCHPPVRIALASVGADGLETLKRLEWGGHEAARQSPTSAVFALNDERRVIPVL